MVVLKKNGKLKIYVDFKKLTVTTKKNPYSLPFMDEVITPLLDTKFIPFWMGL
jgi:hypothetical protein